ncbi:MAG TPA: di-trans,poly-cis-decaprenylcistransferase [Xanthobacteraceae bacterium]|jgi:undecaprenyl diphosphate synthase
MQSALGRNDAIHVAIIMDGNGRWATARGLTRTEGHRAGVETIRRVCEAAPSLGVMTLTLFAFSADNWRRPPEEVNALMGLLRHYLRAEIARFIENGIRLTVIGRRDRLPDTLGAEIAMAERRSLNGDRLHLRIAVDYSSRDAILQAAASVERGQKLTRETFGRLIMGEHGAADGDVDLLIRSGGEKRLSDFLLWECAYAEFFFTNRMWPDFGADDLAAAVMDFRQRERRFGTVGKAAMHAAAAPSPV